MKACPFCAEEIQDAAIICKHCGRDLAPAVTVVAPRRRKRWPWIVGGVVLLYLVVQWSRADYLAFDQRRQDWHRRCDQYVDQPSTFATQAAAERCSRELEALMTEARAHGWASAK